MKSVSFISVDLDTGLINERFSEREDAFAFIAIDERKKLIEYDGYDKKYGFFISSREHSNCVYYLLEGVGSKSEALYYSRIFRNGIRSIVRYKEKEQTANDEITRILIHNTRDIHDSCLKRINNLINTKAISRETNKLEYIENVVRQKNAETSLELLNIWKFLQQISFEYSVTEYLDPKTDRSLLVFTKHKLYTLIDLALNVFKEEFERKIIKVIVSESFIEVNVHYETFKSAIIQILDNCTKYIEDNTDLNISFDERKDCIKVYFEMYSILNTKEEIEYMFDYKCRSENAKKIDSKGQGIGLYISKKMLEINNCVISFNILEGYPQRDIKGIIYTKNLFILTIPI